jgi:hypothetical protein
MKKKLLFKNTTTYSKKLYDQFTQFHNKKFSLSYDLFTIFILILLVYCLIVTIKNKIFFLAILFTLTLIGFLVYRVFSPMFLYKKEVSKKAITKEKTFRFYFYDKSFKIREDLKYDTIYYFKLYKVFETKNFFYLYFNKKYSFIVDKSGFTQGTAEEFSKFIKDTMWLKYSAEDKNNK